MASRWIFCGVVIALFGVAPKSALAEMTRDTRVTLSCVVNKLPANASVVDLWIPVPSDGDGQKVTRLEVKKPSGGVIGTEKTFGNRMLHKRFTGPFPAGQEFSAEIAFDVARTEITIPQAKNLDALTPAPIPKELDTYLKPTSMIPLTGKVASMAKGLDLPKDQSIRACGKMYDYLLARMEYNWRAKGAGQGDVLWACDSKTGDCTDYHSLFIALCRASGIPADHEFGIPLPKEKGRSIYFHCWARFWAPGIGWIPVDISEADKHPELRQYNFGSLSPNIIRMTHGRDLVLEPPQKSGPLNLLAGPYVEVDGKVHKSMRWFADFETIGATRVAVK